MKPIPLLFWIERIKKLYFYQLSMEFNSRRVRLREVDDRDIGDFIRHLNYPEIAYFQCYDYPFTEKSAEELFGKIRELKKYDPRRGYYFAIDCHDNFAGYIDLEGVNNVNRTGYLSYWLSGFFQGERVMSEAMDIVIPFAFNYLDLKNLSAIVAEDNLRSVNLLSSKGFRPIDKEKGKFFSPVGRRCHKSIAFELLRNDYFKRLYERN